MRHALREYDWSFEQGLSTDCAGQSLPSLRHLEATTPVFARPGIVNLLAGCLLSTLANQGVQGIAQCAICPKGRLRQLRVIAASAHFVDAEKRALLEYLGVFGFTGARRARPDIRATYVHPRDVFERQYARKPCRIARITEGGRCACPPEQSNRLLRPCKWLSSRALRLKAVSPEVLSNEF